MIFNLKTVATSVAIGLIGIVVTSCSGGSSSSATPSGTTLAGTAATGLPVAIAGLTIKDKNGVSKTGTTDAKGKYSIDVTGLTAPFLLRVTLPSGAFLYSVGGSAGVVNIHPLTNLIVQSWYHVQGTTVDSAFSNPASNPPLTTTTVKVIASVVENIVKKWLVDNDNVRSHFHPI